MITFKDCLRTLRREYHVRAGKSPNTHVQVRVTKEKHGSVYGGWVINPDLISKDSIVYSFGIGNDISFDLSIIHKYGVNVYAFDPTPKVKDWLAAQDLPAEFIYEGVALSDKNGNMKFYKSANPNYISHSSVAINEQDDFVEVPALRLDSIMKDLGHTHLDILKIDIEGAEYPVLKDILDSGVRIDQVLVEFHHFFSAFSKTDTEDITRLMNAKGYKIFYISPNGYEYSFIRQQ
jgi:FkbM family methyltransferase